MSNNEETGIRPGRKATRIYGISVSSYSILKVDESVKSRSLTFYEFINVE